MFILDTDHLGILQQRAEPQFCRLAARLAGHDPPSFYVSIISFQEQVAGWNAYVSRARTREGVVRGYQMFERILGDFSVAQVLSFDDRAADVLDGLRAAQVRVGTMDLRIGATAIANGMTVLSRNVSDFRKIPGVRVEDWAR